MEKHVNQQEFNHIIIRANAITQLPIDEALEALRAWGAVYEPVDRIYEVPNGPSFFLPFDDSTSFSYEY